MKFEEIKKISSSKIFIKLEGSAGEEFIKEI
jgi:hypothetical protein